MCRGYVGVFQNWCFWLWSPAGSQAIDWVVWLISTLDFSWLPIPCFGSVHGGSQPLIPVRTYPRFQVRLPSQGFGCGSPGHLWRFTPTQVLCVCEPRQPGCLSGALPPRVSGVGPRPLIGVCTHWGTLGLSPRQLGCLSGLVLTRGFCCGPLDVRQLGFR